MTNLDINLVLMKCHAVIFLKIHIENVIKIRVFFKKNLIKLQVIMNALNNPRSNSVNREILFNLNIFNITVLKIETKLKPQHENPY